MQITISQQMKELFTAIGAVTLFLVSCIIIAKISYKIINRKKKDGFQN